MREFNTFGPVYPQQHYHVNRIAVKAALRDKVERGRYSTLNAGRQTGKTTLFREVITELEATGAYFGILMDFGVLRGFAEAELYNQLSYEMQRQAQHLGLPITTVWRHHGDLLHWLRDLALRRQQKGVLILDEFDTLPEEPLTNLLSLFRAMYQARYQPDYGALWSLLLVGVRTIPSLLHGTQSPFNIADQFTVPYFTAAETTDLLQQHTTETGQPFAPTVLAGIVRETEGQPFLVNRLGQLLTQDLVPDRQRAVTPADLTQALALLISENNTHFASIRSKATVHRDEVMSILFTATRYYDFQDEVMQDLLMYGVLRTVSDEHAKPYARIANPIYQRTLIKAFAPAHQLIQRAAQSIIRPPYVVNSHLDFDALLDSFHAFMREHGVHLLRSETSQRPLEISGQYLLLSYLTAALKSIGGHILIEPLASAGEMDLVALYREHQFIVETKVWYGMAAFEKGKQQLVDYLNAAGLPKGYLVVFDEHAAANPLLAAQGAVFELEVDGKQLRVYIIAVQV